MKFWKPFNFVLIILTAPAVLSACTESTPRKAISPAQSISEIQIIEDLNRQMTEKDKDIIDSLIRHKNWTMKPHPLGYYSMILKKGTGPAVKKGSEVSLCCEVRLLDGTLCYTNQLRNFIVDKTNEIAGLHEAVLQMKEGTKARFIFPPHLAYGLLGDRHKIPARAILLFEVDLLHVN